MAVNIDDILAQMVDKRASDIFLKVGHVPSVRVDGRVINLPGQSLSPHDIEDILNQLIDEATIEAFLQTRELDFAYDAPGLGRFRVNLFRQRGTTAVVCRHIQERIPSFEDLGLPVESLRKLCQMQRGLVLVTGVAGSGKSTTLAAMINFINSTQRRHIVTVEDPIEYLYKDDRSVINQRELGQDTLGYTEALKAVVRQSPDVIMIGEMRDQATMTAALTAAETGHLVFSTLHTINATQTVERIINYFPPHQHNLLRLQLSMVLEGVISLRLLPRFDMEGRVPAVEVMMRTPTVRELLYEGETRALYPAIQEGGYYGCQTFNQSLLQLFHAGMLALEDALIAADNPDELSMQIKGVMKGSRATDINMQ